MGSTGKLLLVCRKSCLTGIVQSPDWHDPTAEQEMVQLLQVRSTVLGLLEQARGRRCVVPLSCCCMPLF